MELRKAESTTFGGLSLRDLFLGV